MEDSFAQTHLNHQNVNTEAFTAFFEVFWKPTSTNNIFSCRLIRRYIETTKNSQWKQNGLQLHVACGFGMSIIWSLTQWQLVFSWVKSFHCNIEKLGKLKNTCVPIHEMWAHTIFEQLLVTLTHSLSRIQFLIFVSKGFTTFVRSGGSYMNVLVDIIFQWLTPHFS